HQNGRRKIFGIDRGTKIHRKADIRQLTEKLEVARCVCVQDVVASSWEYVCQGKNEVLQYMKPVHASRHVEHEVDRPSTRCCDACDQAMRLDMWRTWCLLAWSQAMHTDSWEGRERVLIAEVGFGVKATGNQKLDQKDSGMSRGDPKDCGLRSVESEPLALECLGWDSEGLYLLVGDCNSLSNARLLAPHSLLFQMTSSELVETVWPSVLIVGRWFDLCLKRFGGVTPPPSIDRRQPPSIDIRPPPSIDRQHHTSIDQHHHASIDNNPPRPHMMKSQPDFNTREEIDQLIEGIYRALETTEEKLDGRCDDIYFPMDLSISDRVDYVLALCTHRPSLLPIE
uniref:Uncharacterized protein n=1 Tax=Brassica oleracea var. oleracea TaxID=109376 RepID=A0A0D2ZQ60_BRAOL